MKSLPFVLLLSLLSAALHAQSSADLTPTALAGKNVLCTITGGNAPFETTGTFEIQLDTPAVGQYSIPVSSGNTTARTGTYTTTSGATFINIRLGGYVVNSSTVEIELYPVGNTFSPGFAYFEAFGGPANKHGTFTIAAGSGSGGGGGGGTTPAPTISTQPAASQTITFGGRVSFTITVTGTGLTYQWFFNGTAITGATNATYTIDTATNIHTGSYTVVATNAGGSVTSNPATLTLTVPTTFDVAGYFARNSDIASAFSGDPLGAWLHFYNYGLNEGRQYDAQFIVEEYLLLNTDLTNAFGTDKQAALLHWLTWGKPIEDRIGRVPIGFNVDSYLDRYPDLAAAFGSITPRAQRNVTVWNHYLDWGVREGRSDGDFEAYNYLATNGDLAAVFGPDVEAAALHWYFYGRREGRRIPSNFDVVGYRTRNPDIGVIWGNDLYGSWLHYRDTGVYEGRNYDDLFRVLEYRARYSDVQIAYGNNLTGVLNHWLFYGKPESRLGRNP